MRDAAETRLTGKNPKAEESEVDILDETNKQMNLQIAQRAKRLQVQAGIADTETYVARLEEEAREIRRRMAAGEQPPSSADIPVPRDHMMAQVVALMQAGVDPGIIGQVLSGQSANGAIRNPQIALAGNVPDWMGKIVSDAISSKDEVKMAKMEGQMTRLEDKFTEALKATQEAIKNIGKPQRDEVDPMTYATRQAEGIKTFYEVLKGFGMIPEASVPQVGDARLAFDLQDRDWSHQERMGLLQAEQEKIASGERVESRKAQARQDMWAGIPQAIGQAAAKGVEDGMMTRRQNREGSTETPSRRGKKAVITMDEGEEMATVTCECGAPISVVAGNKTATCGNCKAKYPVRVTPANVEVEEDKEE